MKREDRLVVRHAGVSDYREVFAAMVRYTQTRDMDSADELWCLQHSPVYTLGMAGKTEHIIDPGNIPVIKTDRGGQVTYHGPGQLVVYLLLDLKRRGLTIKGYVNLIEQAVIDLCAGFAIAAQRCPGAPGVYVAGKKLASLGIRVKQGCSYHGLSLNIDMDLHPFTNIHPCGYPGLAVTQLANEGVRLNLTQVFDRLLPHLLKQLGFACYTETREKDLTMFGDVTVAG